MKPLDCLNRSILGQARPVIQWPEEKGGPGLVLLTFCASSLVSRDEETLTTKSPPQEDNQSGGGAGHRGSLIPSLILQMLL